MKRTVAFVALLVAAAGLGLALRLPRLNLRPMHVDEAVHAAKFDTLWQTGVYRYDVTEYHGPTLYYATLPAAWLSGARNLCQTDAAMFRVVPVIFGVGLILLLVLIADGLGRPATIIAAVLTAVSPATVYYSRYYIQEALLVFFTLVVIVAGWRLYQCVRGGHADQNAKRQRAPQSRALAGASRSEGGRTAGHGGSTGSAVRLLWILALGVGAGLMHATKETCVIAWGCMFAALIVTALRPRLASREGLGEGRSRVAEAAKIGGSAPHPALSPEGRGVGIPRAALSLAGLVAAAVVSVALFSGFGTDPVGPLDSLRAFATYFQRAGEGGVHEHPWHYYLRLLLWWRQGHGPVWTEGLIVVLAGVGVIAATTGRGLRDANPILVRFLAVYTVLMLLVYSAIPYKTPWCTLSVLHGMILLAGVGAVALVRIARYRMAQVLLAVVLLVGTGHLGWQARRGIGPRFCASQYNPYAYAYTVRDVEDLAAQLDELASLHAAGRRMLIKVIVPDPWPLPWYLRCFERVGYWETVPEDPDADVVLVSHMWQAELEQRRRDAYAVSFRGLRRDEVLCAYVRQDLWDAYVARLRAADQNAKR